MSKTKPFIEQDGFTSFDNTILDYIMPELSSSAWKVLCFIIRKTRGWHKEKDELSFSQIMQGTGIKSSATITTALKALEDKKYILAERNRGDWTSNAYALNLDFELEINEPTLKNEVGSALKNEVGSALKIKDTKETIKENERKREREAKKSAKPPFIDTPTPRPGVNLAYKIYTEETGNGTHASKVAIKAMERVTDLDLWRTVVNRWILCGWRPGNIKGMLDYYDRGELPGDKPKESAPPTPALSPDKLAAYERLQQESMQ